MRKIVRTRFAAPFVVTAALAPGCTKEEPATIAPRAPSPDTLAQRAAPGDAAAADVAADAAATVTARPNPGEPVVYYLKGDCFVAPGGTQVACPDAPPVRVDTTRVAVGGDDFALDLATLGCEQRFDAACAGATRPCNPPRPKPVECPPELLPGLWSGVEPTRRDATRCFYGDLQVACPTVVVFEDPECFQEAQGGNKVRVDCPDHVLPVAAADALVRQTAQGWCLEVHAGKTARDGRVRCPPGGPTVILPEDLSVRVDDTTTISLREHDLSCRKSRHPKCAAGKKCNPPPPQIVPCPDALLPQLAGGAKPTAEKDGGCFHGDVQVKCPT
jgi:hypothetical protein